MTHKEVLDEVNVIYERISQHSKDYDSAWSDGNYTEALEVLIDYYEVGLIEELKKIKEKIDLECDSVDSALDIIIDRIHELKGE